MQMKEVFEESDRLYDKLFPGDEAPSAKALALAAVGDAAFTADPLTTAIGASALAASAIATAAAEAAKPEKFDETYDLALERETAEQTQLLKEMCAKFA
jgi:hypothetical protein